MASTDFNMLRLEAPKNVLQITDGTEQTEETLEGANPATWLRALAKQQKQAEQDLAQLVNLCGDMVDHADQRILQIEQAYQDLSDGTRYVYDRLSANQRITGDWIRSELAARPVPTRPSCTRSGAPSSNEPRRPIKNRSGRQRN